MATHTRRQFTLPKLLLPVAQNYRGRGTKEFIDADAPPAHLPPVGGLVQSIYKTFIVAGSLRCGLRLMTAISHLHFVALLSSFFMGL
jgi:hypothetical protein